MASAPPPHSVTQTSSAAPVTPTSTPPASLSVPVTSTVQTKMAITAPPMSTPPPASAVATPLPPTTATAATAIATPHPTTPTAAAGTNPSEASSVASPFAIGDHIRVQLELEIFRVMQEGHGGWKDDMAEVRAA